MALPDAPLRLAGPADSEALATAFGAQLLSWRCRGRERLYLSPRADFSGTAIRGGVPVIFPQFAARGPGPRHGFARTRDWRVLPTDARIPRLAFALDDDDATRALWPHRFQAVLEAEAEPDRLHIGLSVRNRGDEAFEFTVALHTYLRVDDLAGARLHGLEDRPYLDSVAGGRACAAAGAPLRFDGELDRLYPQARAPLRLCDGAHVLRVEAHGFADAVVWNPGAALAAGLGDLGEGEQGRFVCVEAGCIAEPVRLAPGASWRGRQSLIVER
ncbi:D-hexose-6-phosphate mutarotase [Lysobacter firmicutimachus]|uniref:Putative glucose-6-phosphate 1-epimerase n=1 Tax=Lysobacter firmicutimachus TaxID=1792846 RepID=A0AAU8N1H3_9GAMM